MPSSHNVAEGYKHFVLICLERAQDAGDPAVRAWWTSAAQRWHEQAGRAATEGHQFPNDEAPGTFNAPPVLTSTRNPPRVRVCDAVL